MTDDIDLRRSFILELPEDEIHHAIELKLRGTGATPPKGFRQEHLPLSFIIAKYGDAFLSDILKTLLQVKLDATIAARGEIVACGVTVKGIWSKWDRPLRYRYEVTYEVMPTITINGLDKLVVVDRPKPTKIDDEQLESFMEITRRQHAAWRDSGKPSASGDRIIIDFDGRIDGKPFPGGTAEGISVELGAGGMLEDFEIQLIGLMPGQVVNFPVIFPEEYKPGFLAGKLATFEVKVVSVHEIDLPPLDDSLAAKCGIDGGLSELRTKLREHLEKEHLEQDQRDLGNSVLLQFLEANEFLLPNCLVEAQLIAIHKEHAAELGRLEQDVELTEAMVTVARQRAKTSLLVQHLIAHEGLTLDFQKPVEEQVTGWLIARAEANASAGHAAVTLLQ